MQLYAVLAQIARRRSEAPRFVAGSLKDDSVVGQLPGLERRGVSGEVLPAKGPARAPWPMLSLQVRARLVCYQYCAECSDLVP